tara:strand:+ start:2372 stop:3397 length:1026 start_codon:yes stop_codon:yes gene_type:complete
MNILIFGCGSIGTHHAQAARSLNFNVYVTDINASQMNYMRKKLYPARYGKWDDNIIFLDYKNIFNFKKVFDLVIIGTSPAFHLTVLKKIIKKIKYKKILVEKPLCVYKQNLDFLKKKKFKKNLYCGFNHSISPSILNLFKLSKQKKIGKVYYVKINWKEDFKLVLKAHPWIKSIKDSYLSDINKGGGVSHEYSHAIHLGVCFKNILFPKKNIKMSNKITFKKINNNKYDIKTIIKLKHNNTTIEMDIDSITNPPKKNLIIYGKKGKIYWERNMKKKEEKISIFKEKKVITKKFLISRPFDFINQLKILLINKKNSITNITKIESAITVMKIMKNIFQKKHV